MTMVSPTKTPFGRAGSLGGRSRRLFILPPIALFLFLLVFQLQRSIRSLPPVCPASDSKPARIVSLTLGTDEILLDLVDPRRIRALTYISVLPDYSNIVERARAVSQHMVGSVEEILRLRPDFILASSINHTEKLESLQALGCRVFTVSGFESIAGVRRNVMKVAAALGETGRGLEVVGRMDCVLREADRLRPKGAKKPRVLFAGPNGYRHGSGTTTHDLIVRAGGINAAAGRLSGYGLLSWEEWLTLRPDVILRTSYSPLDPFLVEIFRAKGGKSGPVEVVMPFKLLTSVAPSSVRAVGLLAAKLREAGTRP